MKQRWLIKPLVENEPPPFDLHVAAREELITLMATAIEHVCRQHAQLRQQTNGALIDERTGPS